MVLCICHKQISRPVLFDPHGISYNLVEVSSRHFRSTIYLYAKYLVTLSLYRCVEVEETKWTQGSELKILQHKYNYTSF